jgi:hypothetical protein
MSASGPIMFGFASSVVRSMLESMPDSRLCTKYLRMEDEKEEGRQPRRETNCNNLKKGPTSPKPKRQAQKRSYNSMFSEEEDEIIIAAQKEGTQNDWKSLSKLLKGKTPQQVQSRWYGCLRKRVGIKDEEQMIEYESEEEEEPRKKEVSLDILMETALLALQGGPLKAQGENDAYVYENGDDADELSEDGTNPRKKRKVSTPDN